VKRAPFGVDASGASCIAKNNAHDSGVRRSSPHTADPKETAMLKKQSLFPLALAAALWSVGMLSAGPALAHDGDRGDGALRLITTIPIPGEAMKTFDISWVDAQSRRYFLADRSNKAIDVIDTRRNVVVEQIAGGFAGATGNNDTSGPNGVTVAGHWMFVTDAPSRVVNIDLRTKAIVGEVNTGGGAGLRADELAYDPRDGLILAVNNADSPPFATLIKVDPHSGALTVQKKIVFTDVAHDPQGGFPAGQAATNGAEQPVWEPRSGRFYISIPELSGPGGTGPTGAIARINPSDGAVEHLFQVSHCQPAGLTVGPNQDLLVGCSVVFDTAGAAWSLANPLIKPTATTAAPISLIVNAATGAVRSVVTGVSGNDEVWFNHGDGRYYLAARNQPGGPVLGVVDAASGVLQQVVPTVNQAAVPAASVQPGTAHSVAVDPRNNHAFVPLPANNVFPNCLNGCIAVFGTPDRDHDD
jgi:hypothetical protein